MNRVLRCISVLFIFTAVSAFSCELVGQNENLTPWDFISIKDKPEIPQARVLFDSSHSFDAINYFIGINYPFNYGYFAGEMKLLSVSKQNNLNQITLDMVHLIADSVLDDSGIPLSYYRNDSTITIMLSHPYQEGDSFSVDVYYHDTAQQRGMYHYSRDTYSMAEPFDARWWFPCYDKPWDKATGNITITVLDTAAYPAPNSFLSSVASNGLLACVIYSEEYTTYIWRETHPMSTYLFCMALLDSCASWTVNIPDGYGDSLPCMYYVYREDSTAATYDFANVPAMVNIFNNMFGPYPFEKYGMVAVQPFTYGGMEHQTMTTINRSWLSGNRRFEYGIAHELAHQWWGDMVTLSDFRHVWLNEGFATYAEDIFAENFYGRSTFETRMANLLQTYFYYDEHVGRFPLFDPWAYFNGAEYYKGGLILHMLRGIIGDDNFFTGMRHYGTLYKYGNASTEDFRDAMESVSGVDLDYFFQEWIYEQGYPEYQYAWQSEPFGDHYRVNFQLVQIQQNAPIFSMPIQLLISTTSGDTLVTIFSSQQNELFQIEVTNQPNAVQFDPNNWLIKKSQLTNIELPVNHPIVYQLNQNYPNPFNSHTTISLTVPREGQVKLDVFDIGGRLAKTLVDSRIQAGEYTYNWDGTNQSGLPVAGGVYLYKMTSDGYQMTRKLTYLK